jgi:hypothetical protein
MSLSNCQQESIVRAVDRGLWDGCGMFQFPKKLFHTIQILTTTNAAQPYNKPLNTFVKFDTFGELHSRSRYEKG